MPLLALAALSETDVAAWQALAGRAAEPNPFFEPEYALPLARGTGQLDQAALLVVRDGERWLACLPVRRRAAWHRAPLPNLSTWRAHALYALLGTPLIEADRLQEGADGLIDEILGARGSLLTALEWLVEDGPVYLALRRALTRRGARTIRFETFRRAALARRAEPDYTAATVSAKHLREYRRQRRRLGEELGGEMVVADRAGDPEAVEGLISMEQRSAVAARGSVLASDPRHAAFFRDMCARFAAAGRLQLLVLSAGDVPLAYKCNLAAGPGLFMLKIAFDEDHGRFSPGMQLELEMLNFFHDRPRTAWMDSCADANNAMINRLWPECRTLMTLVIPAPGARGLLAQPAVRALRAVRARINGGPTP
ncbi:MAG: GNAT family N-acetyltransferase [Solirubrobacteraceae bacterium]